MEKQKKENDKNYVSIKAKQYIQEWIKNQNPKMTQKQFAKNICYFHDSHLSSVLSGKYPITDDVAKRISEALNITTDYIVGKSDYPYPTSFAINRQIHDISNHIHDVLHVFKYEASFCGAYIKIEVPPYYQKCMLTNDELLASIAFPDMCIIYEIKKNGSHIGYFEENDLLLFVETIKSLAHTQLETISNLNQIHLSGFDSQLDAKSDTV